MNNKMDLQFERWDEILDVFSRIPAEDPKWASIDEFVTNLVELAKCKVSEHRSRLAFDTLATELRRDLCDLLTFLDDEAASKLFILLKK